MCRDIYKQKIGYTKFKLNKMIQTDERILTRKLNEMKYKILEQEAYAITFTLNADFEYQGKKYRTQGIYYNGDSIVDIEVFNEEDGACIDNEKLGG